MLTQIDPHKIVDYFSALSSLCTVGQHYTGKFLVQWWLRQIKITLCMVIFMKKDDYVVWSNIAPVIFLCNVVWNIFGQHWIYDIPMQCCPSLIDTKCIGYFAKKSCSLTMGQHCTGKVLAQCWPTLINTTLQIIFLCKVVLGVWVNIAQLIYLCNVDASRSRQHLYILFSCENVSARSGPTLHM